MTQHATTAHVPEQAIRPWAECWQVVRGASTLTFSLRHIVFQQISGHFRRWGGRLILDREEPSRSQVTAWIDLASIETGSQERDDHVRSEEFFDVARFPLAKFRSETIDASDLKRIVVSGGLQMHGVTRPIDLAVTPGPISQHGDLVRASYEGRAWIDRQSFGLHWNQDLDAGGFVVGDRVGISAHIAAVRVPMGFQQSFH